MKKPSTELSRVLSHALRHDPGRYGLELDPEGWVGLGGGRRGAAEQTGLGVGGSRRH